MSWEEIKKKGSEHYKGEVEPIDLIRSLGLLQDFALGSIIKYASRYKRMKRKVRRKDLEKIIHYAEMLGEEEKCQYQVMKGVK